MSYHALPTEQLQKVANFLYDNYKGRDDVHELIKFIVAAKPVNLVDPTAVPVESPVNTDPTHD